jgi:hypothetical protein
MNQHFVNAAKAYVKGAYDDFLDEDGCVERLAKLLEETHGHGQAWAGRCSDCGSVHPEPIELLHHIHVTVKKGYVVTPSTPYKACHNVIRMEEALGDYFRNHPFEDRNDGDAG